MTTFRNNEHSRENERKFIEIICTHIERRLTKDGREYLLNKIKGKSWGRGKLMEKYMDVIKVMRSVWRR